MDDARKMRCGACGKSAVELYMSEEKQVKAKCLGCSSETLLTIRQPEISFEFGEKSDGILCLF